MKRIILLVTLVAALLTAGQASAGPVGSPVIDPGSGTNVCLGPFNEPYNAGQYYAPGGVRRVWLGTAPVWLYYNAGTFAGQYFQNPYSPYCVYHTATQHAQWIIP